MSMLVFKELLLADQILPLLAAFVEVSLGSEIIKAYDIGLTANEMIGASSATWTLNIADSAIVVPI